MSKVALIVELGLAPGKRDEFIDRARRHAAACLEQEPGCLHFDILTPEDADDRLFLYEVYADEAAVDTHLATPRMAKYLEDTGALVASRKRTLCRVAND